MKYLFRKFAAWFLKRAVGDAAKQYDTLTTIAGAVLAAVVVSNVDWYRLLGGDIQQIAILIAAVAVGVLGYLTNKVNVRPTPVQSEEIRKLVRDVLVEAIQQARKKKDR